MCFEFLLISERGKLLDMNAGISILMALLSFTSSLSDQITVTIVFENHSAKTSVSGTLYIEETRQTIPFTTLNPISVILPKKGDYHIKFYSEDVDAFIAYPVKISERKNTVTVRLAHKTQMADTSTPPQRLATNDSSKFSMEQMEEGISKGVIYFIVHGLIPINPETTKAFEATYGIGFISENCMMDPMSYKIAMSNNKKIEEYLNLKYGKAWKKQLPTPPFGLQSN